MTGATGMTSATSLYCFDNYRNARQLDDMRALEADGVCIFCPDGLALHRKDRILWRTAQWNIMRNEFPYAGSKLHVLLAPASHVEDVLDLDDAARADFWVALSGVRSRYGLSYYGLGIRNGDCRFTGATIRHVHAHVLVGSEHLQTGADEPIRMRFSARGGRLDEEAGS
jgi:ATP adenylyltransferase